eukprot:superscaffoldBa00002428_g14209
MEGNGCGCVLKLFGYQAAPEVCLLGAGGHLLQLPASAPVCNFCCEVRSAETAGKKAFWKLWHTTIAAMSGCSHCFPPPRHHHWNHGTIAAPPACGYYCPSVQVSGSTAGSPASSSAPSTSSRQYTRQRITRVNLRDLIFYMEQERETAHSLLLYRALLK